MNTLPPISSDETQERKIEKIIKQYFLEVFFWPLMESLKISHKTLNNSNNTLITAFKNGILTLQGHRIIGELNPILTKELKNIGAKYNVYERNFTINFVELPESIQNAIRQYTAEQARKTILILSTLSIIQSILYNKNIDIKPEYKNMLYDINSKIDTNLERKKSEINFGSNISKEQQEMIIQEYTNNMNKYVKNFLQDEIVEMRKLIQEHITSGGRAYSITDILRQRYGISINKAKFLSRQESSLFTTQYSTAKYQTAGIKKFKWSSSHDSRVRHLHRELDGKIFSYDNLPIIDERTRERGLPGEAYGCRCLQIPILD